MADIIYPINCASGIKRDGTRLEGNYYVDGLWTRFNRGVPKKIGGYRQMTNDIDGVTRTVYVYSAAGINRIYCGTQYKLQYLDDTELDLKNKKPITINELLIAIHPTQCPHCGAKKE